MVSFVADKAIAGDTTTNIISGSGAAASLSPQVDLLQTSYKCHVRRETTPYYCHSRTREMVHHHRVVARGTAQDSETVDTYAWTARCQGLSIFEPHPNDQIPHNQWFVPPNFAAGRKALILETMKYLAHITHNKSSPRYRNACFTNTPFAPPAVLS